MTDNRELNRANLKKFIRERPLATHAMFRREDNYLVDIPLLRADFTINQERLWLLESVAGGQVEFTADAPAPETPEIVIPPKPSEEEKSAPAPETPAKPAKEAKKKTAKKEVKKRGK